MFNHFLYVADIIQSIFFLIKYMDVSTHSSAVQPLGHMWPREDYDDFLV